MQDENNRDQINCYKNVGTKLTVALKCRDQNSIFAKKKRAGSKSKLKRKKEKKKRPGNAWLVKKKKKTGNIGKKEKKKKKSVKKSNVGEGAMVHGHFHPKMMLNFSLQLSLHFEKKIFWWA